MTAEQREHNLNKRIAILEHTLNIQYWRLQYVAGKIGLFEFMVKIESSMYQIYMIKSTPVPKFPSGGFHSGGITIVGEKGKEMVINNGRI